MRSQKNPEVRLLVLRLITPREAAGHPAESQGRGTAHPSLQGPLKQGLLEGPGVLLKDPGVLLKDPGIHLKDPGILLKDPWVLSKDPGVL